MTDDAPPPERGDDRAAAPADDRSASEHMRPSAEAERYAWTTAPTGSEDASRATIDETAGVPANDLAAGGGDAGDLGADELRAAAPATGAVPLVAARIPMTALADAVAGAIAPPDRAVEPGSRARAAARARVDAVRRNRASRARHLRSVVAERSPRDAAPVAAGPAAGPVEARPSAVVVPDGAVPQGRPPERDRPARTATDADAARDPGGRPPLRLTTAGLVVALLLTALVGGLVGGGVTALATGAFGGDDGPGPVGAGADRAGQIAAAVDFAAPSVVSLRIATPDRNEVGSGIVLAEDGLVLTNAHVITLDGTVDDAAITGTTHDGRVFAAETVAVDVLADLAVVRLVGAGDLLPATFADSAELTTGETTIVLGSPLGLVGTATSGIVSTVDRSIEVASAEVPPSDDANADATNGDQSRIHLSVFQTDADINPGNSGGPVVNLRGEVIGVSVAIATRKRTQPGQAEDGSIGLGFAIPAAEAMRVAAALTEGHPASHGALGATLRSADRVATGTQTIVGAYVDGLTDGGAAQRAGLRRGDIVIAADGVTIASAGDLLARVRTHPGGDTVPLTVVRDGGETEIDVVLDQAAA